MDGDFSLYMCHCILYRYQTKSNFTLYYKDYLKLYIDTILPQVQNLELDPHRPFVSSSPSNGVDTEKSGWMANDPQSTLSGDSKLSFCIFQTSGTEIVYSHLDGDRYYLSVTVHHYDYVSNGWDPSVFPVPRFTSEYGFQSWPSFNTIAAVSTEKDWNLSSQFVSHRQHHPNGTKIYI